MPILAYCVALAMEAANPQSAGVGAEPVLAMQEYGLECWYNEVDEQSFSGAEQVQKAALEFHRFISNTFAGATILPFRFPTILDSVEDLRDHLDEKAQWYANALEHIAGTAQFEARIIRRAPAPAPAESGTEYMQQKKETLDSLRGAESAILRSLADYVRGSHAKEAPGGMRLYLLSEKIFAGEMRQALAGAVLPQGLEVRFSGPWPPTEFLPGEDEL